MSSKEVDELRRTSRTVCYRLVTPLPTLSVKERRVSWGQSTLGKHLLEAKWVAVREKQGHREARSWRAGQSGRFVVCPTLWTWILAQHGMTLSPDHSYSTVQAYSTTVVQQGRMHFGNFHLGEIFEEVFFRHSGMCRVPTRMQLRMLVEWLTERCSFEANGKSSSACCFLHVRSEFDSSLVNWRCAAATVSITRARSLCLIRGSWDMEGPDALCCSDGFSHVQCWHVWSWISNSPPD